MLVWLGARLRLLRNQISFLLSSARHSLVESGCWHSPSAAPGGGQDASGLSSLVEGRQ